MDIISPPIFFQSDRPPKFSAFLNPASSKIFLDVAKTHVVLVSGKRGCLTEETLVYTNRGYKKISEFDQKKDKIYSFNKKNVACYHCVAKTLRELSDEQIMLLNFTSERFHNFLQYLETNITE